MTSKEGFGVWEFLKEVKVRYRTLVFPFSEGSTLVCKNQHTQHAIVDFTNQAEQDTMVCKFFEALGYNIQLEREKEFFWKEVLGMRKKSR